MTKKEKYSRVIPSLYACYDKFGKISPEGVRSLCRYLIREGAGGLYVCGSAGECVYLTVEERMLILECVMGECGGEIPVIAHVACPTTEESRRLAAHAASAGADAISALPPFFYKVSLREVADYWNAISAAAAGVDFFIYDIPTLSPNPLGCELLSEMVKNPDLAGIKASGDDVGEVETFSHILGEERCVLCGSDGLLNSALALGACGGIGGTYAVRLGEYTELHRAFMAGDRRRSAEIQSGIWRFLDAADGRRCCIYALMKEILRQMAGIDAGGVRGPLGDVTVWDVSLARELACGTPPDGE